MSKLGCALIPVSWQPQHLQADAKRLARECAWVNVPLGEQDLALHAADWPRLVATLQDAGIAEVGLSPWGLAGLFGGEPPTSVAGLCPASCAVRGLLDRWAEAAVRARPDFVLLDEPHQPKPPCAPSEGEAAIQRFAEHLGGPGLALHLYHNAERAALSPALVSECSVLGVDCYPPCNVADRLALLTATARQFRLERCAWLRAFRCGPVEADAACTALTAAVAAGVERIGIWSFRAGADCAALRSTDADGLWRRLVAVAG